ncbi:hypothetical protein [Paraburkholderia sp. BL6669N2]|uniref:hypothetical protein n=1 Tax=Paraburkholderia sp. BL6669N2 TaxID=1938807 RepID=UPI0011C025FC|nr:hypothetical protein [Paraburkholderia sp. BL6669N2]
MMLDPGPLNDALLVFAKASLRGLALINGPVPSRDSWRRRGGFLVLPEPVSKVFVDAQLPQGIPALYDAVFPKRHHFFNGAGGYETILARFRYRGASEDEIPTAIRATLRNFRY